MVSGIHAPAGHPQFLLSKQACRIYNENMKKRGLFTAATAHAGLIALACSLGFSGTVNVRPRVAVYTAHADVCQPQQSADTSETKPVEYPEVTPVAKTEPDVNPLELDASDVLPKLKPRPRAIPPQPLRPPAETDEQSPPRSAGHFTHNEPTKPKPVEQAIESDLPAKKVSDQPRSPGAQTNPVQIQHPPRVVKWNAPPDVRRGFSGRIVAVIQIDENGNLSGVHLDPGTGNKSWDRQLRNAFRKAEYKAATINGKPIASELRQPVDFE